MKASRTFLTISIISFVAFLLLAYMYLNTYFSLGNKITMPWIYIGAGILVLLSLLVSLVRYIAERNHFSNFEYDEYDDTVEVVVVNESNKDEVDTQHINNNEIENTLEVSDSLQKTDFNQLEEDLLSSTKMENIYEIAAQWIFSNIDVSYVAFSNIINNEKLSVEFFKESIPSEAYLVEAVAERAERILHREYIVHGDFSVSVPYFKKGEIFGFVFLGSPKKNESFEPLNTELLPPFIRILSTACLVIELAKAKEQRSSLQKAFSSYVPSAIVDLFEHDPSVLRIGGEYENLTIMFTDLREFTTLSETMAPDNLITVLNEYFSEMSGVIENFGGTVSKLVGDGILAFFGGPGSDGENHAEKCCEAALTMKKYEDILNSKLMSSGKIKNPLFTRIGISTGKVILGNIGSEKRLDYTVMGPEVNLASRIEEANKKCGTAILISYETFLAVRNVFECRRAAFIKLKGFSKSVYLFELLSKIKTPSEEKMSLANDLSSLFGISADTLLVTDTSSNIAVPTHAIPQNAPVISDDDLEEFEDAEELEELD